MPSPTVTRMNSYSNYSLAPSALSVHKDSFRISLTLAGTNEPARIIFRPITCIECALTSGPDDLFAYYSGAYSSGILLAIIASLSILVLLFSIICACFSVYRRMAEERTGLRIGTMRLGGLSVIYQTNAVPLLPDSPASRMTVSTAIVADDEDSDPTQPFSEKGILSHQSGGSASGSVQYSPEVGSIQHTPQLNPRSNNEGHSLNSPLLDTEERRSDDPDYERERSVIAELAAASHGSRCSVCACAQRGSCLPGGCFNRMCCSPFVVKRVRRIEEGSRGDEDEDGRVWVKSNPLLRLAVVSCIAFISVIYIAVISIDGLGEKNPLSVFTLGSNYIPAVSSIEGIWSSMKNAQAAVSFSRKYSYSGSSGLQSLISALKSFSPPAPPLLVNEAQALLTIVKKFETDSLYVEGAVMQATAAMRVSSLNISLWIDATTSLGFSSIICSIFAILMVYLTFFSSSSSPFGKEDRVHSRRMRFGICCSFISAGIAFASASSSLIPFFATADACSSPEGTVLSLLKNSSSDWFAISHRGADTDDTDDKPKEGFEDDDILSADDDERSAREAFFVREGVNLWLSESTEDFFWRCGESNASFSKSPSPTISAPLFNLVTSLGVEGVNIYATSWSSLRNAIFQHSWTVNNQKALVSPMTHVEYALSGIFNETVRASSSTSCSAVFANWKTAVDSVCASETVWVYWRNHILFLTVAGLSSFLMCSYLIYFYVLTHDPTLKNLYSQYLFKQHNYHQTRADDIHEDRVLESDNVRARDAATRPEDPAPLVITSEQQPEFYPPLPLNSPSASPYAGTVTTSGVSPLSLNSIDQFGSSPGYILSPQQVALQRMWQQQQQTLQQQWHLQQRQQSFGGFAVGAMPLPLSPTNSIAASVTYSQRTMTTIASAPPQPQPKDL